MLNLRCRPLFKKRKKKEKYECGLENGRKPDKISQSHNKIINLLLLL